MRVERAHRAFGELGLRCACLFPALHRYRLDDERVAGVFEVAATHRGAIFAHCGFFSLEARTRLGLRTALDLRLGDPLALATTAARYPSVPVIVPHFGGGFFREALMAAEACPSMHFDTSSSNGWIKYVPGLTLADVFKQALAVVGPGRLVFGSDSSFFPRGWRRVIHGAQRAILEELGAESGDRRADLQRQFRSPVSAALSRKGACPIFASENRHENGAGPFSGDQYWRISRIQGPTAAIA